MSVNLSPVGGAGAQFCDNNGNPLSGGKLYTYAAGTTTPAATYTSAAGSVFHTNPIVLNAGGRVPDSGEIWLDGDTAYKFILKTSADTLIATWDDIWGIGAAGGTAIHVPTIYTSTGDGSNTTFSLSSTPISKSTTSVHINGVYQEKSTYSLSGASIVFSEAPPATSSIEVVYA